MPNITLAEWLTQQLRKYDLTQNELARRVGLSSATLTNIRRGTVPTVDTVKALARYFKEDTQTLMEIAGLVEPILDLPRELPPEMRDMFRRLQRLPNADRYEIIRLLDQMLSFVEARIKPSEPPGEKPDDAPGDVLPEANQNNGK